jgi:hypothetical protein
MEQKVKSGSGRMGIVGNAWMRVTAVAAVLVVVGAVFAVFQIPISWGSRLALLLSGFGVIGVAAGCLWALIEGPEKAAKVIDEGRVVLVAISGVVLVLWGQALLALGFVASWRLVFPPRSTTLIAPGVPQLPSISDAVQLLQALTVAPTWLGLTTVGLALTLVGAWVIRHSKSA